MKLKILMFAMFFGLLSVTIMTGCSDKKDNNQEKTQENGHGHSHD